MSQHFDYFVVLAGMRTGSNLLEEHLTAMPGVHSWGELFNPHFFGQPKASEQFGISMQARERDPIKTIQTMCDQTDGLPGFRLFYDHDNRAIDHVLADPKAAKIVLNRRPIDSYVSLKIARKTGQWWLGDVTSRKSAKVDFVLEEYGEFLNVLSEFQSRISHTLQITGQTAFHISYDDLSDSDVLDGLGKFLGVSGSFDPLAVKAKVQNPAPLSSKMNNPEEAEAQLAKLERPDIGYMRSFEPDRGPGLRMFKACETVPLLYMPIRGAGIDPIPAWMEQVDPGGTLQSGMTQKELRRWKRLHPGHRSFTVLRHPLERAYDAFNRYILPTDEELYSDIRSALVKVYGVPLPETWPASNWTLDRHRAAFLKFLEFVGSNLTGQTSLRVDNTWASQHVLLTAVAGFATPDSVIREGNLSAELPNLLDSIGVDETIEQTDFSVPSDYSLSSVVSDEINKVCEATYRRDYIMFGFERRRS